MRDPQRPLAEADELFRLSDEVRTGVISRDEICRQLERIGHTCLAEAVALDTARDKAASGAAADPPPGQDTMSGDLVELDDTAGPLNSMLPVPDSIASIRQFFDDLPFAAYMTDASGYLNYFNPAAVEFSGRMPTIGKDKWCVTWRLLSLDGVFMPHDKCPMALAIRSKKAIRGSRAIAERPNGQKIPFMPFPTPIMNASNQLAGALNVLLPLESLPAPARPL